MWTDSGWNKKRQCTHLLSSNNKSWQWLCWCGIVAGQPCLPEAGCRHAAERTRTTSVTRGFLTLYDTTSPAGSILHNLEITPQSTRTKNWTSSKCTANNTVFELVQQIVWPLYVIFKLNKPASQEHKIYQDTLCKLTLNEAFDEPNKVQISMKALT